ncbi:unnamed protein product, partial [marine sediment metagenome]
TAAGGTPGYSYLWNTGETTEDLSNICAEIYCVTVTDTNLCTAVACITITEPSEALSVNIVGTDVLCYGDSTGAADLTVNGGTPAYSYLWDTGETSQDLSNIGADTFCVTVTDANSCTATACVTITEPPAPLIANIAGTDVDCNGAMNGAADLSVSDGTTPYSYLWNTGLTTEDLSNIPGGIYCVTVTDANGCSVIECVTITEPTLLTINIDSTQNVTWYGGNDGAAYITVNGGTTPYSYLWDAGYTTED